MHQTTKKRGGRIDRTAIDELEQITMEIMSMVHAVAGPKISIRDISFSQYRVLCTIHRHGPLSIGELGRKLGSAQSAISEMIARLQRQKLVEKERGVRDARIVMIRLTPSGAEIMDRRRLSVRRGFERMLHLLSARDRREFLEAHRTIRDLISRGLSLSLSAPGSARQAKGPADRSIP